MMNVRGCFKCFPYGAWHTLEQKSNSNDLTACWMSAAVQLFPLPSATYTNDLTA